MNAILSANKANRLFWLGRYAERGYLMLHLMRRAYDEVIDVPVGEVPYSDFLKKMDVYVSNEMTTSYQMMEQLYDPDKITSLRSIIEMMMDNAIVLRADIFSESFSYIELCRDLIRAKAEVRETNISELQPITDWLLAFWGCIRERVHGETYSLLEIGRLLEHLDMCVRFDYKYYRIEETWETLKRCKETFPDVFDAVEFKRLEGLISDKTQYTEDFAGYKANVLSAICSLVLV
ncbi:MAG: alpha-E domain-containing protein [Paludibacteraceae bacterium]|nr:alpha-E domain-containing protein [Paludibacteraceae bacterium]